MTVMQAPDPYSAEQRLTSLREHLEKEKGRRRIAEGQLGIAVEALRRLSVNDEMAGMGQRDADPELRARCRHAASALEKIAAMVPLYHGYDDGRNTDSTKGQG